MSTFDASKASILENLNAGVDFSFKGSIDAPILELVHFLNGMHNFFTTSSCSGRVSVFRSGLSAKQIKWILVKHRQFNKHELLQAIAEPDADATFASSLVTLKCEPFILHINCRDLDSARMLHEVVTLCGFRESGIKLGNKKTILAVRTTANCMELPLARGAELIVSESYLDLVIAECNSRLASNFARIDKFLLELKRQFRWPVLQLLPSTDSGALGAVKRWGHTCCTASAAPGDASSAGVYVIGGYGTNAAEAAAQGRSPEDRNQRGLESLLLSPAGVASKISVADDSMHAVSAIVRLQGGGDGAQTQRTLLLISGGRQSPSAALPCVRLFDVERSYAAVSIEVGGVVQPAPRWGHSLTPIRQNATNAAFLLYGGRDEQNVYHDAYILHITLQLQGASCVCAWEKLNLSVDGADKTLPAARFFHAACATLNVFPVDDSVNNEYDMVVVHGGMLSIPDPVTCGNAFVIDPNSGRVADLLASSPGSSEAAAAEGEKGPAATSASAGVYRFGHSLTSVGAKCLLLVGGASFNDSAQVTSANESFVLDVSIDAAGAYRGQFRPLTVDASSGAQFPCQSCRAHHQVVYNPYTRTLQAFGGGALTLAFGGHYCPSWEARLTHLGAPGGLTAPLRNATPASAGSTPAALKAVERSANQVDAASRLLAEAADQSSVAFPVLFVPAQSVRPLKVFLEEEGLLDKSQSIARVEEATFRRCNVNEDAAAASRMLAVQLTAPCSSSVSAVPTTEAARYTDEFCGAVAYMAVPISSALETQIRGQASESSELLTALGNVSGLTQMVLGVYATRSSKRSQVNSAQKANELLLSLSARHQLPVSALSDGAPSSRFEVVGDVLMLPERYLTGERWDAVLGLEMDATGEVRCVGNSAAASYRQQVFSALAGCFGLQRVARKAEIDSGPKRESKVRLLHPVVGMPAATGPGSNGWVTAFENKIGYSFDITRVMFCSGNVTERMRMAVQASRDDVVVDLYCGIGYYTVPLLLHGKARHVHACEWNPNSVLALRDNLRRAGVAERCTVYEGDNKISSEKLDSLADRVLLGLLPSSVTGWALAARALKATGGVLHVHENVLESILDTWVEETRAAFQTMLQQKGKALLVSITHLEKVKSYAPRVYHVVLDLHCTPIV